MYLILKNNYLTTVNIMEPKEAYEKFENELLELLPSDQQEFIAQLEGKGVIDAEDREKMNVTIYSDHKAFCTAVILENIEGSLTDSDEKFYALLDVMEEYKNGLDLLALKIKNHLNPSTYIGTCVHKIIQNVVHFNILLPQCMGGSKRPVGC